MVGSSIAPRIDITKKSNEYKVLEKFEELLQIEWKKSLSYNSAHSTF